MRMSAFGTKRTMPGLKSRSAAGSPTPWGGLGRHHPARFRTIQVCPKDWPSLRWQAVGAEIHACDLRPREIRHEAAGGRGAVGLGCRHHGSRAVSVLILVVTLLWVY